MYRQFFIFRQMLVGFLFILAGILPASSFAQATICGSVFLDQNQNHIKDSGELLRANQVVYLIDWALINRGQGGYFTTVTGENGQYCFLANTIGDYGVFTDIPTDMTLTTPVEATGAMEPYSVKITSASQQLVVDFGFLGVVSADEPIWGQCQDESKDDSVCVSNADYTMQVTPHKDATEVVPMTVSQASDGSYQGDNAAAKVVAGENDAGTRSARKTRDGSDEFAIVVGKNVSPTGEEVALDATVNPDNSVSFTDPQYPSVAVTAHPDGTYTGVDSETPTVSVAFDQAGNISATDSDDPTMSLVIDKATGKVTVTDSEYPTSMAVINSDGSRTITDEEFPHLIATIYANNEYVVQDLENNMVVHIDSQGNYTVIDNKSGVCVAIPGTRGWWKDFWNGAKKVVSGVVRFVSKVAGFVAKVARFVVKVTRVISVVARVVATIAKVAAVLFPALCSLFCAVASFAEGVARISDMVGNFAEIVATIAERIQQGGLLGFWVSGRVTSCPVDPNLKDGVYSCSRPTMIIANHNYVTYVVNGVTQETIGRSQSIGNGGSNTNDGKDLGPEEGGVCKLVIDEDHPKKDAFLDSIKRCANYGVWIPYINDCYNAVENAAKRVGLIGIDTDPPCPRIGPCVCP